MLFLGISHKQAAFIPIKKLLQYRLYVYTGLELSFLVNSIEKIQCF